MLLVKKACHSRSSSASVLVKILSSQLHGAGLSVSVVPRSRSRAQADHGRYRPEDRSGFAPKSILVDMKCCFGSLRPETLPCKITEGSDCLKKCLQSLQPGGSNYTLQS